MSLLSRGWWTWTAKITIPTLFGIVKLTKKQPKYWPLKAIQTSMHQIHHKNPKDLDSQNILPKSAFWGSLRWSSQFCERAEQDVAINLHTFCPFYGPQVTHNYSKIEC